MADSAGYGRFIDEATVEYERTFPHPIERVWRAITEPADGRRFTVGLRRHERWNELNKIYRAYIPQALPPVGPA